MPSNTDLPKTVREISLAIVAGPVTQDNNFTINAGMALVEGMLAINHYEDLTHNDQESLFGITLPAMAAPTTGIRDDLVYLDVWEEEVGSSDTARQDIRLTNPSIGVETSRRIERRWVVRVEPDATDLAAITPEDGHVYLALAQLRRTEGQEQIQANRITDLRRTDLNVAKYLRVPVYVQRGTDIVDSQRLADLLEALRNIFLTRLEDEQLFVDTASNHDRTVVYFAVQQITQVCATGAMQASTNNLTNADAPEVLSTLYDAQAAFLTTLTDHGNGDDATTDFIDQYRVFLTGGPGVDGIETPLAEGDLIGAYLGQQELNAWLSAIGDTLPEGNVFLQYLSVLPFENLQDGQDYDFTVEFTSGVSSDQDSEIFDVSVRLSLDLWSVDRVSDEITLNNDGGTGTLVFAVTPNAANTQCEFTIVAQARRNPTIVTTQSGLQLEIGVTPPVGAILQYAGSPLNDDDQLELSAAALAAGFGTGISFALNNRTDESHTYTLRWFISLDVGDETGWSPVEGTENESDFPVSAQSTGGGPLTILGPTGGDVAGNIGTLHVSLIQIDGAPLDAENQESIDIDFIVNLP